MTHSKEIMQETETYGAKNYKPLPLVLKEGKGVWVSDLEGNRYMDMLSAYSALNHGHRHPKIIECLKKQADLLTLTSRAFYNTELGALSKELADLAGMDKMLPMNTGAEAVETALKLARKWGYEVKGVPHNQAEIIVCSNNFHGRTITIISFSSEPSYKDAFGPHTPGFKIVPYGDLQAMKDAIHDNTVAVLLEPIQGEGGVILPPKGYLSGVAALCRKNNVLFMDDEIQVGMGRTGKMFCFEHEENAKPDVLILGKALGGGVYPVSAVLASKEVMGLFQPGDHGSTFGGNPLGCAVAREAIRIIQEEDLVAKAREMGNQFTQRLQEMNSPFVKEVRGKGLLIGVEVHENLGGARPFCEALMKQGILCKETKEDVIRFAPPLVINQEELDWALLQIRKVFIEKQDLYLPS